MNKTITAIGSQLQLRYCETLDVPMNWRMIDAFAKLQESEDAASNSASHGEKNDRAVAADTASSGGLFSGS